MKRAILWAILCVTAAVLVGCVSIEYPTSHGTAKYLRIGDQKLSGLRISSDANMISAQMDSQESQAQALNTLATQLVELSKLYVAAHTVTTSALAP